MRPFDKGDYRNNHPFGRDRTATVVDGIQNGFRMMIVEDAVADRWAKSHQQSLYEMNAKYGDVIHSENAIDILRKTSSFTT